MRRDGRPNSAPASGHEQNIQRLAERAVETKIAADAAKRLAEQADQMARAAVFTYVECLEARLKVRDLPPAA